MCTVSMVYDHYRPIIPQPPTTTVPAVYPPTVVIPGVSDLEELRQLIAEFKEAVAAAKVVDRLTDQADCEDPKKASLEERVRRLEELIGAGGER
jgi:hypothetical protein